MDTHEKVLAAFEMECQEQVEGIRAIIAELAAGDAAADDGRLNEAFRLAHTLKGGARVCDLKPAEKLGHQLETLFAEVRQGKLCLDRDVVEAVTIVLDSIEDWMSAVADRTPPPETDAALRAVERVLVKNSIERVPAPNTVDRPNAGDSVVTPRLSPSELAEKLRQAFAAEHKEYLLGLRSLLTEWETACLRAEEADVREAFRLAHSLKGAANAADVPRVAEVGHRMEVLLGQVRDGKQAVDATLVATLRGLLDTVEQLTSADNPSAASRPAEMTGRTAPLVSADGASAGTRDAAPFTPVDMVRVSAQSLDHLVRSSGQLAQDSLRYETVRDGLIRLQGGFDQLERQREAVHQSAAAGLHRLSELPQFGRVMRYFDELNLQLRVLSRSARRVGRLHEQAAWQLRTRGAEVHRHAREARMVPVDDVFHGFRKMVRDLARDEGKQVEFVANGFQQRADRIVLQSLKDPVMHMLRNAVVHGIERPDERAGRRKVAVGRITLSIEIAGSSLRLLVDDDGRGIDFQAVSEAACRAGLALPSELADRTAEELAGWIFQPGLSTSSQISELSGRGMGLSVVQEAVKRLKGHVRVCPKQDAGTCLEVDVPLSVSTHRLLRVLSRKQVFALRIADVVRLMRVAVDEVETIEGRPVVRFDRRPVPLVGLPELLGMAEPTFRVEGKHLNAAIVCCGGGHIAIGVDALLDEKESMIQDLTGPAALVKRFAGAVLGEDNTIALVLNPAELIGRLGRSRQLPAIVQPVEADESRQRRVLVVDDSFTTRTLEKSILEAHGCEVHIATDGVEALAVLRSEPVDLVICDVEMPRMDGFQLLAELKKDPRLRALPIVLVTSRDKREDQQRGLSLGADAYIVKQKFDHQELLTAIDQML